MTMHDSIPRLVNTDQAEAWNGYEGAHWAGHPDRYDAVNSEFNEPLLAAVGLSGDDGGDGGAGAAGGARVLDVGCGNGQLTRLAARRAARGAAVGLDLSAPMLETARERAAREGVGNVAFVRGDAQTHTFDGPPFDAVLSRFGVMFFADPVAAFANLAGALRPGGRLAFVSMRPFEDQDLGEVVAALSRALPAAPWQYERDAAPEEKGPVSLSDPAVVRGLLERAGFTGVGVAPLDATQRWGSDAEDAASFLAAWGPVRHHMTGVGEEVTRRAGEALTEAMRRYEGPRGVELRGAAWLVTAVRP
ncbi:class I SAM-dependent methyltransferase [Streptomyces sp. NPDC048172]|uniref:class I SAM-dependent methyltransferase n=1 Tax=Streptomyces sp. NPDC048172 TaxID=3365505 RepID=UPI0037206FF6